MWAILKVYKKNLSLLKKDFTNILGKDVKFYLLKLQLIKFLKKIKDIVPVSLHKKFFSLFIFTFIGIFIELLGIGLIFPVITIITTGNFDFNFGFGLDNILNNFFSNLDESQLFVIPLLVLLASYGIKGFYLLFLKFYNAKFCYYLLTKLSNAIYKNYLYQDHLYHLKRNSSDLIRIITGEINFFLKSIILPLITVFTEILILIGIILLLLSVETKSTIYVLTIFLFFFVLYFLIISKKLKKWGEERIFHEGKKIQNLTQGLHGIKIVKIFNQEKTFLDKFNFNVSASAKANQYSSIISQIPSILIEFIAVCLIVFFMIYNVRSSINVTEFFPTLALFTAAAFRILPSINRLVINIQSLKYASSGVEKIYKEFPLKSEIPTIINPKTEINFNNEINISNLSFKYPENNENILQDINLKIKFAQSIGFIGKTGVGKSTLIDLICGLLNPNEGKILVDDKNIQGNIKSWQQKIGYVPQDVYLLDDTIKQNIVFGKKADKDTDKNLMNSIKLAQLDKLISKLPEGINTIVGDRGARLSGGQIQRIGIARAINNNAKILIFDESTSALDAETEKGLINDIYKLKSKKTLIMISHRMSILEHCDHVYNLKNKSIFLEK